LEECQVFKGIDFDPISSYPKTLYPSYTILNPKIEKRKSRNTANFYTLMMENLSQWRKFPKRSNSLICTTDYYKARMYGTAYRVIPIDLNAKFGVCPEEDIWESFERKELFIGDVWKLISISEKYPATKKWGSLLISMFGNIQSWKKDTDQYRRYGFFINK